MNPDMSNNNFELPAPQNQGAELSFPVPESTPSVSRPEKKAEAMPASQPFAASQDQSASMQQASLAPQAQPVPSQQTQTQSSPASADDSDLIEKEWVTKAKQIVAATRNDPHKQNREINKFKADYLKKRYNKDIKTEEE